MNTTHATPVLAIVRSPKKCLLRFVPGWAAFFALAALVPSSRAAQQALDLHGFGGWKLDSIGFVVGHEDRTLLAADVNGDDLDDIIEFAADPGLGDADSDVYVAINRPDAFTWKTKWHDWFCIGREYPLAGDFNGDGRDDIACLIRSESSGAAEGDVYVALSTGTAFGASSKWHDIFCVGSEIPFAGDFNGDGKDDLVSFTADANADVYVTLSNGGAFVGSGGAARWHTNFCPAGALPRVGDFNGDGRDDIACFVRSSQTGGAVGDVYVALSTGTGFGPAVKWHDYFCVGTELPFVGDFNGDGADDILTKLANGTKYVAFSRGSFFQNTGAIWHRSHADGATLTGRFNADLNTDLIAIREVNLGFNILRASIAIAGGYSPPATTLPSAFGYATRDHGAAALGNRPLLVVLLEQTPATGGRIAFSHPQSYYNSLVFGPGHPSISGFFTEMSGGKFTWSKKAIMGPIPDPGNPADNRHLTVQQIAANNGFDFGACDTNGDHIVDSSELVILLIDNYTTGSGQAAEPWVTVHKPGGGTIQVRSPVAAVGHRAVFDIYAHELAHCIGSLDLYGLLGDCAFPISLMGAIVSNDPAYYDWERVCYLDIWHRMALGWVQPLVYDMRAGPGAAVINAAQLAASGTANRPVILYDSSRGTNEFYMLEYRTGLFDDGVRVCEAADAGSHFSDEWLKGYSGADFASAGYDLWVNYRYGPGMAIWYVQIDPNKKLVHDPQQIVAGRDGTLESTASGDDIKQSGTGPITAGPNNVLDSTAQSTDGVQGDYLAILSLTPGPNDRPSRYGANKNVYTHADGALDVEWFDETPVDLDIRIGTQDNRQASVSWGARNQPFIESLSQRIMWPGSPAARLDLRAGGRIQPAVVLYSAKHARSYPVETGSWDLEGCTISIPGSIPEGRYLLQTQVNDGGVVRVSNSLPVTITDPYDFWAFFSLPHSFLRHPSDDPDADGWNNFAEYAMSSNPALAAEPGSAVSHGFRTVQPSGNQRFYMQWPMVTANPIVDYRLDYSWDLRNWYPVTIFQSLPAADPDFNWLRGYCDPDPVHDRAFLQLRFIKTNEP